MEDNSEDDSVDVEFGLSSSYKGTDLVEVMWGKDEEETKSNSNELNAAFNLRTVIEEAEHVSEDNQGDDINENECEKEEEDSDDETPENWEERLDEEWEEDLSESNSQQEQVEEGNESPNNSNTDATKTEVETDTGI